MSIFRGQPVQDILTTAGDFVVRGSLSPARIAGRNLMPLSVKEPRFGAVGDGTTDDTAAFQAWLTALSSGASGGMGFIPNGRYRISTTLTHPSGVKIFGVGGGDSVNQPGSVLLATSSLNGPILKGSTYGGSDYQHHSALCDVRIDHTSAIGGDAIAYGATGETFVIDRVMVGGAYRHGISFTPSGSATSTPLHIGKLSIHGCGRGGSGSGLYLQGQAQTAVLIEYVGGDNNHDALIELDTLDTDGTVHIHAFKSERWNGYTNNPWAILIREGNGGNVSIGVGRLHWPTAYVGAEIPAAIHLHGTNPARVCVLGSITWDTAALGSPAYLIYSDNTGVMPHVSATDGRRAAVNTGSSIMSVGNFSYALGLGGNLRFLTDNAYDIGASGATRPRDLFLGRNARISGNLGVGNSVAATTLGTVVKKVQIFDAAGNSLGYIPVYDTIT